MINRGVHVLLVLLVVTGRTQAGPDDIYLENGGYKGILIAIDNNVPHNEDILQNLKVSIKFFLYLIISQVLQLSIKGRY